MTDELESQRKALASEIEHLRIQRDQLTAQLPSTDHEAELLRQAKAEHDFAQSERDRIEALIGAGPVLKAPDGDVGSAVSAALERQRIADHTAEQDNHLAGINGSVRDTAKALAELVAEVAEMKEARAKETAVSEALAAALVEQREHGLTARRLYISVFAILLPMLLVLALTIFK